MFLIRTVFWLTLLILLLPTGEEQQQQVYGTAEAAVNDIRTFCVRNPEVCATTRAAFDTFSQKAQFGARMVMGMVQGGGDEEERPLAGRTEADLRHTGSFTRGAQNTLTADDLKPAWSFSRAPSGT